jgi:hypothetical protein
MVHMKGSPLGPGLMLRPAIRMGVLGFGEAGGGEGRRSIGHALELAWIMLYEGMSSASLMAAQPLETLQTSQTTYLHAIRSLAHCRRHDQCMNHRGQSKQCSY